MIGGLLAAEEYEHHFSETSLVIRLIDNFVAIPPTLKTQDELKETFPMREHELTARYDSSNVSFMHRRSTMNQTTVPIFKRTSKVSVENVLPIRTDQLFFSTAIKIGNRWHTSAEQSQAKKLVLPAESCSCERMQGF